MGHLWMLMIDMFITNMGFSGLSHYSLMAVSGLYSQSNNAQNLAGSLQHQGQRQETSFSLVFCSVRLSLPIPSEHRCHPGTMRISWIDALWTSLGQGGLSGQQRRLDVSFKIDRDVTHV